MNDDAPNPYQWGPPPPAPPRRDVAGWWAAAISGVLVLVLAVVLISRQLIVAANHNLAQTTATATIAGEGATAQATAISFLSPTPATTFGTPYAPTATATFAPGSTPVATATLLPTATSQPTATATPTATSLPTPSPTPIPWTLTMTVFPGTCAGEGGPPYYFPSFELDNNMSILVPWRVTAIIYQNPPLTMSPTSGNIDRGGYQVVNIVGSTPYQAYIEMQFFVNGSSTPIIIQPYNDSYLKLWACGVTPS